jgi:ribonuclease HI
MAENTLPEIPPFRLLRPNVDFSLHSCSKNNETPLVHLIKYKEFIQDKRDYTFLFTDGSKDASGVSGAVVSGNTTLSCRLPNESSIFSAEAQAIFLALQIIEASANNQFYIFSDSLSSLEAIASMKLSNPLILRIIEKHNNLCQDDKQIRFCWVPSHVGIDGNEAADAAAKTGLNQPIDGSIRIPYSDLQCRVRQYYHDLLQAKWNTTHFNKLRIVKETLGKTSLKNIASRRDEIVLHRLRIGHTRLTHSYLLNKENAPECPQCLCLLTVDHIMIQCPIYDSIRKRFYSNDNMKDLFLNIPYYTIIGFLQEIQLYSKI